MASGGRLAVGRRDGFDIHRADELHQALHLLLAVLLNQMGR